LHVSNGLKIKEGGVTKIPSDLNNNAAFVDAAKEAHRLAVKWGIPFKVAMDANQEFHVVGERAAATGMVDVGIARSETILDFTWEWADGRDAPAPPSPYDVPPKTASMKIRDLPDDQKVLIEAMLHVMQIQYAYRHRGYSAASPESLLRQAPPKMSADMDVPYGEYLEAVVKAGCVQNEIDRLNRVLQSARQCLQAVHVDEKGNSERIIFGYINAESKPRDADLGMGLGLG
jgi:hypothetical protein